MRLLNRFCRLLWPPEADAWQRATRVAAGVGVAAIVLLSVSLLADRWDAGGAEGTSAGRAANEASTGRGAAPSPEGYARWETGDAQSLLMIPAVGRDGEVWVGEQEARTLTLHHPGSSRPQVFPLPVDGHAHTMGVTVDRANIVWLAQDGTHAIARFDPELQTYTSYPTPTPTSSPFGITTDEGGRVWFTELGAGRIGVFDPATETFVEHPLPGDRFHPYWLAVAADGRVWFTTLTTPFVGVLDPSSGAVTMHRVPGLGEQDGTTGIDVAPDDTVWFGVRGGALGRLDPAGLVIETYRSPQDNAYGVAVDTDGRVWLASTRAVVYAFAPSTRTFCPVPTGEGAWWLATAGDGSVWISESARGANGLGWISPRRAAACG